MILVRLYSLPISGGKWTSPKTLLSRGRKVVPVIFSQQLFKPFGMFFRIDSECFVTSFSSKQDDILIVFFSLTDFDIGQFKLSAYFYVRLAFRICQSVFLKYCKSCNPKSLSFQLNIAAKNNWFVAWHAWEIENERIFCWG